MAEQDNEYYVGNTISLEFDLFKDNKKTVPWNLSDYQIRFELFRVNPDIKIRKATANVAGGSDDQLKLDSLLSNRFNIFIQASETANIEFGIYSFEIEITNQSINEKVTIAADRINLLKKRIKWDSITD